MGHFVHGKNSKPRKVRLKHSSGDPYVVQGSYKSRKVGEKLKSENNSKVSELSGEFGNSRKCQLKYVENLPRPVKYKKLSFKKDSIRLIGWRMHFETV